MSFFAVILSTVTGSGLPNCFLSITLVSCILRFCRSPTTTLGYELNVIPRFNFPLIFLEKIIKSDLPVNLHALACRSECNFEGPLDPLPLQSLHLESEETNVVTTLNNKDASRDIKENIVKAAFGPLSPSTGELNTTWGIFGKSCSLDRPRMVDEVHLRRFDGLLVMPLLYSTLLCSIYLALPGESFQ